MSYLQMGIEDSEFIHTCYICNVEFKSEEKSLCFNEKLPGCDRSVKEILNNSKTARFASSQPLGCEGDEARLCTSCFSLGQKIENLKKELEKLEEEMINKLSNSLQDRESQFLKEFFQVDHPLLWVRVQVHEVSCKVTGRGRRKIK